MTRLPSMIPQPESIHYICEVSPPELERSSAEAPEALAASEATDGSLFEGNGEPISEKEFREIYDTHFTGVWHALRRLWVAERDLMDAAQNVFLVVHRRLPEFRGRDHLRTWIFQICRRVASDYRRSAPVRREVITDAEELNQRAEQIGTVIHRGDGAERAELARALLDKLPEAQREVFILFELLQLSGEEIATELGLPLGTVKSRLRLARAAFRGHVAALCGDKAEEATPEVAPFNKWQGVG